MPDNRTCKLFPLRLTYRLPLHLNTVYKSVADAANRSYSYVFITTKAIPEIARTPDILRPLLSSPYADLYSQPTYVVLQNGLNVERDLHEALVQLNKGPPSIIASALYILANLLGPNVVEHDSFVGLVRFTEITKIEDMYNIGSTFDRSVSTCKS